MTDNRYEHHRRTEQQSGQSTPERAQLAEKLRAVAGIEITDDVFLGVIIPAENGNRLHVETRPGKLANGLFRLFVRVVNSHRNVGFAHGSAPWSVAVIDDGFHSDRR